MTVKEFIEELQTHDQNKNIWLLYDPPYAVDKPEVVHLVGYSSDYAEMYSDRGVQKGDYAIIAG